MSNTEELREAIVETLMIKVHRPLHVYERYDFEAQNRWDRSLAESRWETDQIMQLIARHTSTLKAEYEEKVREARIDELNNEADRFRRLGFKGLPPGFQNRMNKLQPSINLTQPPKEGR